MSVETVNSTMDSALLAIASANYTAALDLAIIAQGDLARMPDSEKSDRSMNWDSKKIQDFIANLRTRRNEALAAATSGGIQRTKVQHARPSAAI